MLKKVLACLSAALTVAVLNIASIISAQTVKPDPYDVINKVTEPLNRLTDLVDETDSYDRDFYSEFLTKAYMLHVAIIDAENNIDDTNYDPRSSGAIQEIRSSLKSLDVSLEDMQDSARASDQDELNANYDSFTEPYNAFFESLDGYDKSIAGPDYTGYYVGAAIVVVLVAPFLLRKRAEAWDARGKKMTTKDNKSLAISPVRFIILNVLTLGMYSVYWSWKLWEIVGNAQSRKYHSVLRSIFFVFTSFRLLKELGHLVKKEDYDKPFNDQAIALSYLVASILFGGLVRQADTWKAYAVGLGLCILVNIIILLQVVRVQNFYVKSAKKKLLPLRKDLIILCVTVVGFLMIALSFSLTVSYTAQL